MSRPRPPLPVEPFSIHVDERVLLDLRARIRNTRWPDPAPGATWEQGTDLDYLRQVFAYWADEFDWRAQERKLNELEHFRVELDGVRIHFVHQRARRGRGVPLVLTNGWPSTFVELLPLVPLLTDPTAHGIDGAAFDVVLPSLPGYGFSERPARTGSVLARPNECSSLGVLGGRRPGVRLGLPLTRTWESPRQTRPHHRGAGRCRWSRWQPDRKTSSWPVKARSSGPRATCDRQAHHNPRRRDHSWSPATRS